MKKTTSFIRITGLACVLLLLVLGQNALAVQEFRGVCAGVKIQILQELTFERVGFLATLELTNNESEAPITDFAAALTFIKPATVEGGEDTDASDMFFVTPPDLTSISSIDGDGTIQAGETITIEWFIIPKTDAGGTEVNGQIYKVGANLSGALYDVEIDPETLDVIPDTITVRPEPRLAITYFQPRDVDGDNPFTPNVVESPIPFTLGVLVHNEGYGTARDVQIRSQQPVIVENTQGLILIAQLLGCRVMDSPLDDANLTVNLGDVQPGGCAKGAWDMITSLSGEFVDFSATYTHSTDLGGEDTSLITSVDTHFIAQEVLCDLPGRDGILDFLADTDRDENMIPDTVYESDCTTNPVNYLSGAAVIGDENVATVTVHADVEGWVYMRVEDLAQFTREIDQVVRNDGKTLAEPNTWLNIRYDPITNDRSEYLNIFDFVSLGDYAYTVTYSDPAPDSTAPVTTLRFSGSSSTLEGVTYVTPDTWLYFTVEDASPVGTKVRVDGEGDFEPAYPFFIDESGVHTIEYYSKDSEGNTEEVKTATVAVPGGGPAVDGFGLDLNALYAAGAMTALRPDSLRITATVASDAGYVDAQVDVFSGVLAWPTLEGVPSTPTRSDSATLTVGGVLADYYKYQLNGGDWSAEYPILQTISLNGLSDGRQTLNVNARNAHGDYLPEGDALSVAWSVDASAPPIMGHAEFAIPSAEDEARFGFSGADMFRHRIDAGYFHAEAPITETVELDRLIEDAHVLDFIGKTGVDWQSKDSPTSFTWLVDYMYGHDFSDLTLMRTMQAQQVGQDLDVTWNGRDDAGNLVPAGWYTIRLTLTDSLGNVDYASRIVEIREMAGTAVSGGAQSSNPDAKGRFAVWQSQETGTWNIMAQDLANEAASPYAVTTESLNQQNPATDGRMVVWEAVQADGVRDIMIKDLLAGTGAVNITQSGDTDEQRPDVHWPFVVYEAKASDNPDDPWQVRIYDLENNVTVGPDSSSFDQLYPTVWGRWCAWQDMRDTGWGEIYMTDILTGEVYRITDSIDGQYRPDLGAGWLVWQDNREGQNDIFGCAVSDRKVRRLTATDENETLPSINGRFITYEEDSMGADTQNIRTLVLGTGAWMQLTGASTQMESPRLAAGKLVCQSGSSVSIVPIPKTQAVFSGANCVVVTQAMADAYSDAYTLLEEYNAKAGAASVSRFTSLAPAPVMETATWADGAAQGENFSLEAGTFVWTDFGAANLLELGMEGNPIPALAEGLNVLSGSYFPDDLTAWTLIKSLGVENVNAVRGLNAAAGRWSVAYIDGNGELAGEDFVIPASSVLLVDMAQAVNDWNPWEEQ
ncbi:hypothetical protein Dalk_1474 [Desulfatibacillum aliphaticivorans]|uniref:FlgD Ig-like domain-containing protein n=1 Tax=Desulfatibacillum aliphaticivorans TaxID=218208 RepID=B8FA78_DESAL|nr:hypothetical protein [Desulfatibacillum aliphaticivorans]ACL03174.1 hypothetical protein Dalk_1474 [Desulfatibacillum aliphaticivorans]